MKRKNVSFSVLLALAISLSGCRNEPQSGTIAVTPANLSLTYAGMITVTCKDHRGDFEPAPWTLVSNQAWLTFSLRSDGSDAVDIFHSQGSKTVYLIAEDNLDPGIRTAEIFLNGAGRAVVTVTQNEMATLSVTLLDHFENGYDKSCSMYCQAIRLAGLEGMIEAGGITCVVPNNTAFYSFLASMKVASLAEVHPAILRSLLLYLIFPGEYRTQIMNPNENYQIESLSGDPIFINLTATTQNEYRMVINDSQELASDASVTVLQQDYRFKNQVVAQVVPTFVIFRPMVAQTEEKPGDLPSGPTVTLTVNDDIYGYGGTAGENPNSTVYNNRVEGIYLTSSTYLRYGFFKFLLPDIPFKDDISSANLTVRVYDTSGYAVGEMCNVEFRELHYSNWTETTDSWVSIQGAYSSLLDRAPVVAGSATFTSRGDGTTNYTGDPLYTVADITQSIRNYYLQDSTQISLLLRDMSARGIYLYDKDRYGVPATLELAGSLLSAMTLVRNNLVVLSEGSATLHPDNHFAMTGPALSNGYNYTDANIIYTLKSAPINGMLTLYGVPIVVNSRFTQAEMRAGVVKYFGTTGGADSFVLQASDYLECLYANELTVQLTF